MKNNETGAITVSNLTRRYGYRIALKDVSLEIPNGGVHALFGSNGAGKSTLLRILSTLLRPHKGQAKVFGFDVEEEPIDVRRRIGVIGDKALLYAELTGRENLVFYGNLYDLNKDEMNERIDGGMAYSASKAGIERMTNGLAEEVREYGISANVLKPADFIDSEGARYWSPPDTDFSKWEDSKQFVEAAIFLAMQTSEGITGKIFNEKDLLKLMK